MHVSHKLITKGNAANGFRFPGITVEGESYQQLARAFRIFYAK